MKKRVAPLFLLMLICGTANAATPIESGANMGSLDRGIIEALAVGIRASGYKCDSIAGGGAMLLSHGFRLLCNGGQYSYEVEDVGGNWKVTVK